MGESYHFLIRVIKAHTYTYLLVYIITLISKYLNEVQSNSIKLNLNVVYFIFILSSNAFFQYILVKVQDFILFSLEILKY